MPPQQRARACEPCHAIKIKCELGSTGGTPPCERCVRLGKECTISKPRRSKDRVAELEAKVNALTRLLEAQGISPEGSPTTNSLEDEPSARASNDGTAPSNFSKKRRLENDVQSPFEGSPQADASETPRFNEEGISTRLDHLVPRDVQRQIVDKYVNVVMPKFPFVQLPPGTTLETLRATKPLLCQALLSTQGPEYLDNEVQEEIILVMMNVYANAIINAGDKTLEVVQALQIAVSWFNSPRTHKHVNVYQLIHLAADMAADIGIDGRSLNPLPKSVSMDALESDPQSYEARRAWLVCYLLSASITINMRRPSSNPWTPYHTECINALRSPGNPSPHDALLTTIILGEKLSESSALANNLTDMQTLTTLTSPLYPHILQTQTHALQTWHNLIPTPQIHSRVHLWAWLTHLHLHEPLLHTPTNKHSFAGPYLPERLAETDFPKPHPLQPQHAHSLQTLKQTSQSLLATFATLNSHSILAEPGLIYLPRVAYAFYILMKLYIAVTGPGNTLSAILKPEDLEVEIYIAKIWEIAARSLSVHGVFVQKKLLLMVERMGLWFGEYNGRLGLRRGSAGVSGWGREQEGVMGEGPGTMGGGIAGFGTAVGGLQLQCQMPPPLLPEMEGMDFEWEEFLALPDDGVGDFNCDYGFGDLFAEAYDFGGVGGWGT